MNLSAHRILNHRKKHLTTFGIALIFASIVSSIAASPASAQQLPDCYVLSIGLDRYRNPASNLKGCVSDATNLLKVFQNQKGKIYQNVSSDLLTDARATSQQIQNAVDRAAKRNEDWVVFVYSGHGDVKNNSWVMVSHEGRLVPGNIFLAAADQLAARGKKVMIIIDACFSGQLRMDANQILRKHNNPRGGGVIVMVSSMPGQLSCALGDFSAFAEAVNQGMSGKADYDNNNFVTLKELKRYAYPRVYELIVENTRHRPGILPKNAFQDAAIDASLSIDDDLPLVSANRVTLRPPAINVPPINQPVTGYWSATIRDKGKTVSYQLLLDANGNYLAREVAPGSAAGFEQGKYELNGNTISMTHRYGSEDFLVMALNNKKMQIKVGKDVYQLENKIAFHAKKNLVATDPVGKVNGGSHFHKHVVKLQAGKRYEINQTSPAVDCYLMLADPQGRPIMRNDDAVPGKTLDSRIVFTPQVNGNYEIYTSTLGRGETGTYDLIIEESNGNAVVGGNNGNNGNNVVFQHNGQLNNNDPFDRVRAGSRCQSFNVQLKAGSTYVIDMGSRILDCYLRLEDANGRQLAFNDDARLGATLDSQIVFTVPAGAGGQYRVIATTFRNNQTGAYRLTVVER